MRCYKASTHEPPLLAVLLMLLRWSELVGFPQGLARTITKGS